MYAGDESVKKSKSTASMTTPGPETGLGAMMGFTWAIDSSAVMPR